MSLPDAIPLHRPLRIAPQVSSFTSWLAKTARESPARVVLRDAPGRDRWCGRPAASLGAADAMTRVAKLASHFRNLRLPARARVGIFLPGGSEACLAFLAVEEAELTPCLLDVGADPTWLAAAIDAADIRAVVTQTRIGDERPANRISLIAAGFFRLRFLLAFGPDVPDGVLDLDAVLAAETGSPTLGSPPSAEEAGLVTFATDGAGAAFPVFRTRSSAVAACAVVLAAARVRAGDRVVSLLAPDDLAGFVTGLGSALLSGASFEPHPAFDLASLAGVGQNGGTSHLVAPGWMEDALAASGIAEGHRSTLLVRKAPTRLPDRTTLSGQVTDVLSIGETALLAGARQPDGGFGIGFEPGSGPTSELLEAMVDDDDRLYVRGVAAAGGVGPGKDWVETGRSANRDRGVVTELS